MFWFKSYGYTLALFSKRCSRLNISITYYFYTKIVLNKDKIISLPRRGENRAHTQFCRPREREVIQIVALGSGGKIEKKNKILPPLVRKSHIDADLQHSFAIGDLGGTILVIHYKSLKLRNIQYTQLESGRDNLCNLLSADGFWSFDTSTIQFLHHSIFRNPEIFSTSTI